MAATGQANDMRQQCEGSGQQSKLSFARGGSRLQQDPLLDQEIGDGELRYSAPAVWAGAWPGAFNPGDQHAPRCLEAVGLQVYWHFLERANCLDPRAF
jgi:hypothetical protein